ncbi:restriction endonuclease subunit S [Wohlfahrtiimonas chitiniclastica]|uniref:restriction endonuclease subunit S n=1 Tax=Wohlfahrtiimonas chitiniclastica TaxID=400946 RepID=UPI000B998D60|nr:restriction endonuclease subunit S [Wohlfahrtiimonas chitiniclastica]OYQ82385.1 hypothetical protein B9T14_09985 [Wohlfahrtiimonas chitiniclastica]OYQ83419.1 hypothetical protein B9T15_10015 [Wohlfahrtiimonas chitiniclastica]
MSEWKKITLGDICSQVTYGYTASATTSNTGCKLIRITDIVPCKINWDTVPYCDITLKEYEKYQIKIGDILIARTGATTGFNKTITKISAKAVYASYLIKYEINHDIADYRYVGYNLQSSNWYDYVDAIAGGSAQPGANAKQLASFSFLLPPLPEQKAIADVLSALDDKIDLLQRQNETLEKMAETLFRQWFIEETKEDWEELPLSSIATFTNGLACQKYPPKRGEIGLPVLKIKELSSGITATSDRATTDVKSEYIVEHGDIIFAWSASLMVKIWSGETCILNQHLFNVRSDEYPKWFYYEWCKYHLREFISIAQSHATTMGHIKRKDLDEAMVKIPTDKEFDLMNKLMTPNLDKIILNLKQIQTLQNMRDTLLPKLMSGEVRVKLD